MPVESFLRMQKSDGTQTKLRVVTEQPLTMSTAQELVAKQGGQFLGAVGPEEMPPPMAAPPDMGAGRGQPSETTSQETTTTTTPHPWAEGIGAAVGGAIPPLIGAAGGPAGMLMGLPARSASAGLGATYARALMEQRWPTGTEALNTAATAAKQNLVGEGIVKGGGAALNFLGSKVKPGLQALRRLLPVIGKTPPKGEIEPALIQARSWWQHHGQGGQQALVDAWDDLVKTGVPSEEAAASVVKNVGSAQQPQWELVKQTTPTKLGPKEMFGRYADDMETAVETFRKGLEPNLTLGEGGRAMGGYAASHVIGLPAALAIGGADVARRRLLPLALGKAATSDTGSKLISSLAGTIEGTGALPKQGARAAATVLPRGVYETVLPPLKPSSRTRAKARASR